jgi:acetyl esterase/lipase
MNLMRAVCLLTTLILLSGCSGLNLINALSPDRNYQLQADLEYGQNPRQSLDLALPKDGEARGLIVFFYGGGWTSGKRQDYRFVIDSFARHNYAVAIPDYRLYPEVGFPHFVEDGAAAVAWLQRHAEELGIANLPVFLMGHSAGAHIAAMLHFDESYLREAAADHSAVSGFIGLAGPYDFLPLSSKNLENIFAPPSNYPASQPVNFVDGDEAPILLLQGEVDKTVWPRNTHRLAARFAAAGGQAEKHLYPKLGHVRILLSLSPTFDAVPVVETSVRFMQARSEEWNNRKTSSDSATSF